MKLDVFQLKVMFTISFFVLGPLLKLYLELNLLGFQPYLDNSHSSNRNVNPSTLYVIGFKENPTGYLAPKLLAEMIRRFINTRTPVP